jgi:hypothetical protein
VGHATCSVLRSAICYLGSKIKSSQVEGPGFPFWSDKMFTIGIEYFVLSVYVDNTGVLVEVVFVELVRQQHTEKIINRHRYPLTGPGPNGTPCGRDVKVFREERASGCLGTLIIIYVEEQGPEAVALCVHLGLRLI